MTRPSWDAYFMEMARLVSTRSTCDRKHVGAVLVRDRRILATGYNGALAGLPHCDEAGHDLVALADGTHNCVRTTHAEQNALLQCALHGVATAGTLIYVNTYPCWPCARALLAAGVTGILYDADYKNDPRVENACAARGVRIARFTSLP